MDRLRAPGRAASMVWDQAALAAIVVGALIRIVWGLRFHPPLDYVYSDMGGYVGRAQRLVTGADFGFLDAFNPPGTHLLLALPLAILGPERRGLSLAAGMWCAMSILVPVLAWRLGRLLFNPAAAALIAIFCAFWPPFILYGGYFLSEIPSLVFLLGALVLGHQAASRQGRSAIAFAVAAGVVGGAAVAIRPAFVLNLGILGLILIGRNLPKLVTALAFAVAAAVPIGGAMGISAAAAGEYVGINTNSAITFYAGHCPVRLITMEWNSGSYFVGAPPMLQQNRGRDVLIKGHPPTDQEYFFNEGMECVRKNGWGHTRIVLRNIADLGATSDMWPPSDDPTLRSVLRPFNVVYSLAILPIVALSLFSLWRKGWAARRGEALMIAHLACVLATGIFFLGDPRYRMPYDVFGLALVASLIARWFWRDPPPFWARRTTSPIVRRTRSPDRPGAEHRSKGARNH